MRFKCRICKRRKHCNINCKHCPAFISILDLDLLKYAIMKDNFNGEKNLVITCLDCVKKYQYIIGNKKIISKNRTAFVKEIAEYLGIENTYMSDSPYSDNINKL